jgi:cell division protease FtsH
MLTTHREQLDRLAQKLLEKEVIFKDDLEEILGPRQWKERNPANELKPANETKPGIEPAQENA